MIDCTEPRRLRHSFETRCRIVRLILDGVPAADAAVRCGASRATGYRLKRRFDEAGWAGLRDRPPIAQHCPHRLDAAAERQILELAVTAVPNPVAARPFGFSDTRIFEGPTPESGFW